MFDGEIIFHFEKETEKIVLSPVTDLIEIIVINYSRGKDGGCLEANRKKPQQ